MPLDTPTQPTKAILVDVSLFFQFQSFDGMMLSQSHFDLPTDNSSTQTQTQQKSSTTESQREPFSIIRRHGETDEQTQKSSRVSALGIDRPRSLTACSLSLSDSCLACCSILCSSRISSMDTRWRIW
ncbi:hypothetical protein AALO_G00065350, partial [Alosa alosa]